MSNPRTTLNNRRRKLRRLNPNRNKSMVVLSKYIAKYAWIPLAFMAGWLLPRFYLVVVDPRHHDNPKIFLEKEENPTTPYEQNEAEYDYLYPDKSQEEIKQEEERKREMAKNHPKPEPRYQPKKTGQKSNLRSAVSSVGGDELIDMRDLNRKIPFEVPLGGEL